MVGHRGTCVDASKTVMDTSDPPLFVPLPSRPARHDTSELDRQIELILVDKPTALCSSSVLHARLALLEKLKTSTNDELQRRPSHCRCTETASTSSNDSKRNLLLDLSHDELGVIFDGLADPLQPYVAVALGSTCLGLRTPLLAALMLLKERHDKAVVLCRKVSTELTTCTPITLRTQATLGWSVQLLTAGDLATLAMILKTNGLPGLRNIDFNNNGFGDTGMQALFEGLGHAAPLPLRGIYMACNNIGPAGAEALAAALRMGALPKLSHLFLGRNPIGDQGVAALAEPLRKQTALQELILYNCDIGDEGVASLFANLGKNDFKQLQRVWLYNNRITNTGMDTLVEALNADRLPNLHVLNATGNLSTFAAHTAVLIALKKKVDG